MANQEQVDRLKEGANAWNTWRASHSDVDIDLSGAELRGVDLRHINLGYTHWLSHDFFDVDDAGRPVREMDIGADLSRTDFTDANLSGADLKKANLRETNLNGANLDGAEFNGALLSRTVLTNLDLSVAAGLDEALHAGPSSIGIDSIYKSNGKISKGSVAFSKLRSDTVNRDEWRSG